MDDEEEPQPRSRWSWALLAAAAGAALWLAALPLDEWIPEPRPRRSLVPEPPAEEAPEPGAGLSSPTPNASPASERPSPSEPGPPLAPEEAIDPPATTPSAEWVIEELPDEGAAPSSQESLRARLQRQLAMNDLAGVEIEIVDDRVVTRGVLAQPADRQRLALIVRSLAPDLVHEDHAQAPRRP
jgi:hypothetical protein